jgi:hypothetical protein
LDIQHPVVQSVVIPLALALALTGIIRFAFGPQYGKVLAAAASGLALLAACVLVLGIPPWPPRTALEKLPAMVAASLAIGAIMDTAEPSRTGIAAAGVGLTLLGYVWLAMPQFSRLGALDAAMLAAAALVACVIISGISLAEPLSESVPAMLVVAGVGLAGVAFNAGSLKLFQLSLALASATGGYALWNWPKPRYPFGRAGLFSAGLAWLLLALLTMLLTKVRPLALLLLASAFLAVAIAVRIPLGRLERRVVEPLLVALLAAIPSVAAVVLSQPTAATEDDPYYH